MSPINNTSTVYHLPSWLLAAVIAATAVGVLTLVAGYWIAPLQTWLWLVVSFVLFAGVVNGMLLWAAAFRAAQARWTPVINRICHAALAFAPVLIVALVAMLICARSYLPWTHESTDHASAWFTVSSLAIREIAFLGGLWLLWLLLVKWSLAADAKAARGEQITGTEHHRLNVAAVASVMVYSVAMSVVAIDFIMGFAPEWVSTMFPPYYFCTSAYAGLAVIVLVGTSMLRLDQARDYLKPQQFKDIGNLMLAFALFNMGLFFAQYLTIWYENLPEETFWLLVRYTYGPWQPLGWVSFVLAYAVPFVILQSRYVKTHAGLLSVVAVMALVGVAVERYVMVVPSLVPNETMPFPAGILIPIGFAGAFAMAVYRFLRHYPVVSEADRALRDEVKAEVLSL